MPADSSLLVVIAPDRLELGEGARWIDGQLFLVDLLTGRWLTSCADRAPLVEVFRIDRPLGAVAPIRDAPGSWLLAAGDGIARRDAGGSMRWLAEPEAANRASTRMNDGGVDGLGRFWAGSMADDGTIGRGSLYRVDDLGTVLRVIDGLSIANGPAFSLDGRHGYVADSAAGRIDRFDLDPATGEIATRETFVQFDAGLGVPDGMTADSDGGLWVAVWGGAEVRRYRPDGSLDRTITVPASQPTSVCLGGPTGHDLYITSAWSGLTDRGEDDGAVFRITVDTPGEPSGSVVAAG